jgi:hypothetical protein
LLPLYPCVKCSNVYLCHKTSIFIPVR